MVSHQTESTTRLGVTTARRSLKSVPPSGLLPLMLPVFALGIESSNSSAQCQAGSAAATIAIATVSGADVRLLHREPVETKDPHHDDLLSAVHRACKACDADLSKVGLVAVSAGPGGYTAVRIAVTAAKFIAEASAAACVAVPAAMCVAKAMRLGDRAGVVLASKGESAWVTVFQDCAMAGEGRLMRGAELGALNLSVLVADQFLPPSFATAAAESGIRVIPPRFDALAVIEVGLTIPSVDPLYLAPIYPREPEAVTKWRELGRGGLR